MITEKDLQEAIAECQGVRNPNANTAIKLAAFLTIQREMFGEPLQKTQQLESYSFAPEPVVEPEAVQIADYGGSEFLQAIRGKSPGEVWAVMDDLMDTLKMVNARLYNSIMRKIQ